jgi:hypothetical protein
MRSIITRDFAYLFNPWSDGKTIMKTATQGTVTYRRMKALAPERPDIAARLDLIDHRVPEELYQYRYDDAALTNLIHKPQHQAQQNDLTAKLEAWMIKTQDPLLDVFRNRHDPAAREAFMKTVRGAAAERGAPKKNKPKGKGKTKASKAAGSKPAKAKRTTAGKKVAPKYRNPSDANQTWTGRGRMPQWVQALHAAGHLANAEIKPAA